MGLTRRLRYKIPVNLDTLIDEIYVHPDADDWFFEAVTDLTAKYGLNKKVKKRSKFKQNTTNKDRCRAADTLS